MGDDFIFWDSLIEVLTDTLKTLPFLYVTYLIMEYIEDKAEEKTILALRKARGAGPLVGSLLGLLPQCGFSTAAASLFSGGVITEGALIAVFLATSDEMLPVMISESVSMSVIGHILMIKFLCGCIFGYLIDFSRRLFFRRRLKMHIHDLCEQEHCHCEEGNIFLSALRHTVNIIVFIFIISLACELLVDSLGVDAVAGFFSGNDVLGVFMAALIGLIPNCAASVLITQLYLEQIITVGQLMAGLLVGAGVGLMVLYRTNRGMRSNLIITLLLYGAGVISGLIIQAAGIVL